jgi:hypothetical protein
VLVACIGTTHHGHAQCAVLAAHHVTSALVLSSAGTTYGPSLQIVWFVLPLAQEWAMDSLVAQLLNGTATFPNIQALNRPCSGVGVRLVGLNEEPCTNTPACRCSKARDPATWEIPDRPASMQLQASIQLSTVVASLWPRAMQLTPCLSAPA